ncbi:hypothetical protein SAMN05444389_11178 [Paracoccus solventivorans]|uniref:Uncharacterized protein n=1 Tax=Paracoccus solventivorans TaxID=53463 RepID=A0A1M7JD82_9RHOB|nr:hypothetical protein SAMN05444389_11178 [Paracoccus solventivorans]
MKRTTTALCAVIGSVHGLKISRRLTVRLHSDATA